MKYVKNLKVVGWIIKLRKLIWGRRYVEYHGSSRIIYGEVIDKIFCSGCFESGHYVYLVRFENGFEITIGTEDTHLKKISKKEYMVAKVMSS